MQDTTQRPLPSERDLDRSQRNTTLCEQCTECPCHHQGPGSKRRSVTHANERAEMRHMLAKQASEYPKAQIGEQPPHIVQRVCANG